MIKTHVFARFFLLAVILSLAAVGFAQNVPGSACPLHAVINSVTAPLSDVSTVTVTPTCSGTCASTWAYKILACTQRVSGVCTMHTAASVAGSDASGAATLNTSTTYETVSWTAITGETFGYDVYRTTYATTPATTGLIGSVAHGVLTFADKDVAGNGATPPATNTTQNTTLLVASSALIPGPPIYDASTGTILSNPASGGRIHICDVQIVVDQSGTTANFGLIAGTGVACGTSTTNIMPQWIAKSIGPGSTFDFLNLHFGSDDALITPAGNGVCLYLSAAPNSAQAMITYGVL